MYLARPCQYTPMPENPRCDVRYWTSARFAPDVLVSMNEAMDAIAARAPGPGVDLVGYSGGGATTYRRCPSRSIQSMSRLPSVRCRKCNSPATRDYVVSLAVARRFVHAVGTDCARWRAVADVAHDGDWAHIWPALLEAPVSCKGE
ncbi:hypothetical protein [Caballeronia grimmiae]|uniref:hypothetical protein n=1 Tax=Caballeronia grimmiae TaxID=1071679 RepID=UPI000ABED2F2|nr:hypothetical protein [Caballeronia grimmiae]